MTKPRPGGTELFAVRFPVETLARLRQIANAGSITVGALIVQRIEASLAPKPIIDLSDDGLADMVDRERLRLAHAAPLAASSVRTNDVTPRFRTPLSGKKKR